MKYLNREINFILCVCLFVSMLFANNVANNLSGTILGENSGLENGSFNGNSSPNDMGPESVILNSEEQEENEQANNEQESFIINYAANITRAGDATPISGSVNFSNYAQQGGNLVLDGDVTVTGGQLLLMRELTIDLNGYTLTMSNGTYFMTYNGGGTPTLNLYDNSTSKTGTIYLSRELLNMNQGGIFNMYGGIIDGINASSPQMGGCVHVNSGMMSKINGEFNMYAGTIRNCTASQAGGAVYVAGEMSGLTSTFNMYGGTIENCDAPQGAAVFVAGDAPGYFNIFGGEAYEQYGSGKVVIDCDTYNGSPTTNSIYNYGYFSMRGVVDIDGIVYLNQNNWESDTTHFIKITGRLIVAGDGYIDIDSSYPSNNALCPGHTVLENETQTVPDKYTDEERIGQKEFYTYSSYFINSTKGLSISAGYDPNQNELSDGYPSNWPSYQGDKYSETYDYVDVMGQTMVIQAASSQAKYRERQNWNYMIYTERSDVSTDLHTFYSIKISKRDFETGSTLNGATFKMYKADENGQPILTEQVGESGVTGDLADGSEAGETYLYVDVQKDGKMMIEDGLYALVEETPPEGFANRGTLATIEIKHVMDESTGQLVSVVEVKANDKVLTTEEQIINTTYQDKGYLVNKEVVLYLNNSPTLLDDNKDYKVRVEKYEDEAFTTPLTGAEFTFSTITDQMQVLSTGVVDGNGVLLLKDKNGSDFTFTKRETYVLQETRAPDGYFVMDDDIILAVDDNNNLYIGNVTNGNAIDMNVIHDNETLTMEGIGSSSTNGSWSASLSGELLTIKVYDEQKPPSWNLTARKYGTQQIEALALAGAEFKLFKVDVINGVETEREVVSVVSSDGTDGNTKGTMLFVDEQGVPLELECDAKYILRETKAPTGYSLMKDIVIQVDATCSNIIVTQDGATYSGASYDANNKVLTLSIVDEAVYHLPDSGGPGIYFVTIMGIIMMTSTATFLLLYSSNQRRAKKVKSDYIKQERINRKGE